MLAVLRRRLPIATWVIVSTQSLVLALGTAQVCADGEHTTTMRRRTALRLIAQRLS